MSLEPDQIERLRKKLYEKAKREPGFRLYSLYDKVCWPETLDRSYRQAKANAGAAGVDGVRFEDIESYGMDRWLAELRQELMEETYRPQPVRRVMIPKPGGGERPLGIPTIRDRVVQTAVVLFLEPIFEADFEDNVYAYRPECSAHDALLNRCQLNSSTGASSTGATRTPTASPHPTAGSLWKPSGSGWHLFGRARIPGGMSTLPD